MILLKQKSDVLGGLTSTLCLAHCIATPFLFLVQASATTLSSGPPTWWKSLDYLFLIFSFAAIFWTTKTTTINWLKPLMWISYFVLSAIIVNEKLELFPIPEVAIYVPTVALVILHLYNRKYCKCATDNCCVNEG